MNSLDFLKLAEYAQHEDGEWDPGFEGDRRIVISRLGLFRHSFPRPKRFNKRFYHQVFDLKVEDWELVWAIPILSGFCTVQSQLSLRFQATVEYAQENIDRLPNINEHIKTNYLGLIKDSAEKELLRAEDSDLIESGFEQVETRIESYINETLIEQGVQSRARCRLNPGFKKLSEDTTVISSGHFQHDQMVLEFIRNNYQLQNKKDQDRYRQLREQEHSRIEHEEKLLEQSKHENDLVLRKESQTTEKIKAEVKEDERRHSERQLSDERIAAEKFKHQNRLRQLEVENELRQNQDANKITDEIEGYVRRDIQLLVLKRQHVLLKKEIEKISSGVIDAFKKDEPGTKKIAGPVQDNAESGKQRGEKPDA